MEAYLQKNARNDFKNMCLDNLIKSHDNSIIISCKYFKKSNNYTPLIEHIMILMNNYIEISKEKNKSDFVNLYLDFNQVKFTNLDYDFFKILFPYLEEHYPGIIGSIVCVNVGLLFKVGYKIIKSFLSKETRHKIVIQKKNSNGECINITSHQIENDDIDEF